jgi:hypothetical protein
VLDLEHILVLILSIMNSFVIILGNFTRLYRLYRQLKLSAKKTVKKLANKQKSR